MVARDHDRFDSRLAGDGNGACALLARRVDYSHKPAEREVGFQRIRIERGELVVRLIRHAEHAERVRRERAVHGEDLPLQPVVGRETDAVDRPLRDGEPARFRFVERRHELARGIERNLEDLFRTARVRDPLFFRKTGNGALRGIPDVFSHTHVRVGRE